MQLLQFSVIKACVCECVLGGGGGGGEEEGPGYISPWSDILAGKFIIIGQNIQPTCIA